MSKIRDIIRLDEDAGLSIRQISRALSVSRPVVTEYLKQAKNAELKWADVQKISDDFGLSPLNADDRLSLLELLDDRYHTAGTIITGQVPIGAWHEIIGEPTIADAVMDRLAHTPWIFELKGGSRRQKSPSD